MEITIPIIYKKLQMSQGVRKMIIEFIIRSDIISYLEFVFNIAIMLIATFIYLCHVNQD